jgi:hypothetical protein
MQVKNIQKNIKVLNKVNGKEYVVTDVAEDGKITLTEVLPEDADPSTIGDEIEITEANAPAFRFLEDPNPVPVPTAAVADGELTVDGEQVVLGNIKVTGVLATLPGVVILSNQEENGTDIIAYNVRDDRFQTVASGMGDVRTEILSVDGNSENDLVVIVENRTKERPVLGGDEKPVVDEDGNPVTETVFEGAYLYLYKNAVIDINRTEDDEEYEDDYGSYDSGCGDGILINFPIENVSLVSYQKKNQILVTSNKEVGADRVIKDLDGVQVAIVPVIRGILRRPASYKLPGKTAVSTIAVDTDGKISNVIRTEKAVVYTNAGHRERIILDEKVATELDGYDTFCGIRFAKRGTEVEIDFANAKYEIKTAVITQTADRGPLYSVK